MPAAPEQGTMIQLHEIVQIPLAMVAGMPLPDGATLLMFTTPAGRQYQFRLDEGGRRSVRDAIGTVPVFTPGDIPAPSDNGQRQP